MISESKCPNCFAPVRPETGKCEYCGMYLTGEQESEKGDYLGIASNLLQASVANWDYVRTESARQLEYVKNIQKIGKFYSGWKSGYGLGDIFTIGLAFFAGFFVILVVISLIQSATVIGTHLHP